MSSSGKKKKGNRRWLVPAIIIAAAALLLVPRFLFPSGDSKDVNASAPSNIRSVQAERGSITTSVSGSGTLVGAEAQDVQIPEGVKVDTYYVSSGDRVREGDVLASVDRNSILTTLADIQSQLDDLDEQLEDKADDAVPTNVKAGVSGRVKQINAAEDDSVSTVIAQRGSLILLSLDGKMAVDLPASGAVALGDTVTVTLSDGTDLEGAVARQTGQGLVVTMTDNGPVNGETVSVTAGDGSGLGSGTIYIHSPLAITGYSGTVSAVRVKENEKVSADTTLMKLTDVGHTAEYQSLLIRRQELVDQLQSLTALYQDNSITAPFDGTIKSVEGEEDSPAAGTADVGAVTYSGGFGFFSSASPEDQGRVVLLTSTQDGENLPLPDDPGADPVVPPVPISMPLTGWIQLEGGSIADYAGQFSLVLVYNNEVIQRQSNDASGRVAFDELTFSQPGSYVFQLTQPAGADPQIRYDTQTSYLIAVDVTLGAGNVLNANVSVSPDATALIFLNAVASQEPEPGQDTPPVSLDDIIGQIDPDSLDGILDSIPSGSSAGMGGLSGIDGGLSGFGGFDTGDLSGLGSGDFSVDSSAVTGYTASSSTSDQTTILTISPDDHMTVSVSVDELDILSIRKGQSAQVSVDALGAQPVEGTVTGIDSTGSSAGGVTKYTVEVTLDKTEQMLANMNASVEIVISQSDGCLIIPEAALNQTGTRTFVYTGYDETTGELSGEREVATGVSDGTNVEITSGLTQGETVYYLYNDAGGMDFGFYGGRSPMQNGWRGGR